jgi:hypothetical protein
MISDTEYADSEYARAIAEFVSRKGVTRCPTACLAPTEASVSDADRVALRSHAEIRDAVRRARRRELQQMVSPRKGTVDSGTVDSGTVDGGIADPMDGSREAAD